MDSIEFLSLHDIWILVTVSLCLLFLIDDLFIDIWALLAGLKPKKISPNELSSIKSLPEKKIAIVMANWKEADIIERTVTGNIDGIQYANYKIYLGVYPNDKETLAAARRSEAKYKNVEVVVNSFDGPTSKGQMLNEIVRHLSAKQSSTVPAYDILLMHDSEDVVHPLSLKLLNARTDVYDYIQIPVFSLDVPITKFTAGIYIDEFIESHTKELLVRDALNAGVPSAGVGTALRWSAVDKLLKHQNGNFLKEDTLTEDYHLGLTCHDLKMKVHFSSEYYELKNKNDSHFKNEYIATREYFPQKIRQSVRQKTRWSLGIGIQGFLARSWRSNNAFGIYFLWRDRKGLFSAPLFTSSTALAIYFTYTWFFIGYWPSLDHGPFNWFSVVLMWTNLVLSIIRVINRVYLVSKVYGLGTALFVPLRWVGANFINTISTYSAIFKWIVYKAKGNEIKWAKTDHMLPVGFGSEKINTNEF